MIKVYKNKKVCKSGLYCDKRIELPNDMILYSLAHKKENKNSSDFTQYFEKKGDVVDGIKNR